MKSTRILSSLVAAAVVSLAAYSPVIASDHADGPTVAGDQGADLADCYMFPDPSDPSKIVIISTVRGFIVPGEAGNFGLFDAGVRFRFQIENTGDFRPDAFIDVTFSEKKADPVTGAPLPQNATVIFRGSAFTGLLRDYPYTGLTVNPTLAKTANPFPDPAQKLKDRKGVDSIVDFFAGETDDPFFFDIPGFSRFRASVLAGTPDPSQLQRGRDTFAGYNILTIAFRLPVTVLKNRSARVTNTTKFGLNVLSKRRTETTVHGRKIGFGPYTTVDRQGLPAINALLVPFNLKNAYNAGTTVDDHKGKFADAIVGTLNALHTSPANIDILAGLGVTNGDFLRLDTTLPVGFPNGRLPADDVVKTLLTIISNANESGGTLDDGVAANDVPFETVFPYLGLPHQPRDAGVIDDNTRN